MPTHIELPRLEFQETTFPADRLARLFSCASAPRCGGFPTSRTTCSACRIAASSGWITNCARRLRVLGPLRGRALLSDEVGLGKTIEAGLVLKELLTRGMVKRFLVLTVPSLVDQWEEELSDKFGLTTVTTNHAGARGRSAEVLAREPGPGRQPAHPQTAGAA